MLESGRGGGERGGGGEAGGKDEEVGTDAYTWTHIPIQTQVTLLEAEGLHEELPLGIEKGERQKETKEGGCGAKKKKTAALAFIICILKEGGKLERMPWS